MFYWILELHFQSMEVFHISFSDEIYAIEFVESEKGNQEKRADNYI